MLPLMIVVLLLLTAAVIIFLRNTKTIQILTLTALGIGFVLSVIMAVITIGGETLRWSLGTEPWNVSILVGPLESFMSCLFTGISFLAMWASLSMIKHDLKEDRLSLYYALICSLIGLLCGVVFFENMINVFLFIELSSFAAAGIVIIKNQPENIRAGLKYLTLSILGSGLVLMGIVIFFTLTGSLSYSGISLGLENSFDQNEGSTLVALVFITIGVCFKSAVFPFHIWLPDAHATAPSPSSAVLSSLVLKAFLVFYIKTLYQAVGVEHLQSPKLRILLDAVLILGIVSMLFGSILAILQTDIKRMISYSSVAQIGYIVMGIGLGTKIGLISAVLHIMAHSITKSGLFLNAGSIIEQTHNRRLDKMGGIGIQMPVTMSLFTVGALSMIGLPLFIGFNSKWNFAMASMESGKYWILAVLAVSTLLNALYYLPVVVRAFFGEDAQNLLRRKKAGETISLERPIKDLLPIIILAALVVFVAIFNGPFIRLIESGVASIW